VSRRKLLQTYPQWAVYAQTTLDTVGFNANLMMSLLLTVNRLCIFIFPTVDRLLFRKPAIY
jgi:hypothetical protein